jgi:membrane-associated phospholipid phosphatase
MIPERTRSRRTAADSRSAAGRSPTAAAVGGLLVPLGVFALLATAVTRKVAVGWDTDILRYAERHYQAAIVPALGTVVDVSIGLGAAVAGGAVVVLLVRRRRNQALFWALVAVGVPVLDVLLKEIFRRPALGGHEGSYAFPSGNAMGSAAIAAAIVIASPPRWRRRVLAVAVPVLVAYGALLVYAWWHYPTDVLAGWCIAIAWVTALWLAFGRAARNVSVRSRARGEPIPTGREATIKATPGRWP